MKATEIIAGDEYAAGSYDYEKTNPYRVRVIEVGVARVVKSAGYSYKPRTTKDGVLVEILDRNTGENIPTYKTIRTPNGDGSETATQVVSGFRTDIIRNSAILNTWDEQIAIAAKQAEYKAAQQVRQDAAKVKIAATLAKLNDNMPHNNQVSEWSVDSSGTFKLSYSQMTALLAALPRN